VIHRLSSTTHFLTIDAREYYHDAGFERVVSRDAWSTMESRLERTVDRLMERLEAAGTRATFFVPGSVARQQPALVRRIAAAGHEVAAHGDDSLLAGELTPRSLRSDARSAKAALESATGMLVTGFRAPFCMLASARDWALEVLVEEGYEYDSSCVPQRKSEQGGPAIPGYAHVVECAAGTITEVPPTPIHSFGRLPMPGVVSPLRGATYGAVRRVFEERTRGSLPGVMQLAAWEVDPDQPRLSSPLSLRWRHYNGLGRVQPKLDRLLRDFRFEAIGYALADVSRSAPLTRVA
jgi:polysaccharide deacetylase family protein (PEP-CTERM system associated)